jgi:hypothetical protein
MRVSTTIVTTVGGKRGWNLAHVARLFRCVFVVYSGDEPEKVQEIVQSMREWYDNIGIVHKLTDEELVESLPYRLQSYILWALFMNPDTDEIADQSPHDPFGAIWRTQGGPSPASVQNNSMRLMNEDWSEQYHSKSCRSRAGDGCGPRCGAITPW